MARVTVEDCLDKVPNRFALVILAAERARQISDGARTLVTCDNKPGVAALRELRRGSPVQRSVEGTIRQYLSETRVHAGRPDRMPDKQ